MAYGRERGDISSVWFCSMATCIYGMLSWVGMARVVPGGFQVMEMEGVKIPSWYGGERYRMPNTKVEHWVTINHASLNMSA